MGSCLAMFGCFRFIYPVVFLSYTARSLSHPFVFHCSVLIPPLHVVTRAIPTLSFLYRVFSIRQNPEPRTPNSTQNRTPSAQYPAPSSLSVPIIQVVPPQAVHHNPRSTHPQLRNTRGQFAQCTAATTLRPANFTPEGSLAGTASSLPSSSAPSTPSSITFSDQSYLTDTPATSPAPQIQLPLQQNQPLPMSESKGSIGWTGEGDDQLSPGQFLREIDNKIDERNFTTEEQKVKCMRNNIAYGSPADDWFGKLKVNEKDTYEHLTAAFEREWPLIATVKESKAERIRALKEWTLKPEELGKKTESSGGILVWSHVKWANGLAS